MLELQVTAQPLTVLVGETLQSITAAYVCINDLRYRFDSPLKAIDICFKSFFALNAKFPIESEQVWVFIQKYVFQICTKWDKDFASVNTLIAEIKDL